MTAVSGTTDDSHTAAVKPLPHGQRQPLARVGKALQPLPEGRGLVTMLVALQ